MEPLDQYNVLVPVVHRILLERWDPIGVNEYPGKLLARPELDAIRAEVRVGNIRKLYVYRLDRLTRSGNVLLARRHARGQPDQHKELAGHTDLATTQRYMHLSPAMKDSAIRLLEQPIPEGAAAWKLEKFWRSSGRSELTAGEDGVPTEIRNALSSNYLFRRRRALLGFFGRICAGLTPSTAGHCSRAIPRVPPAVVETFWRPSGDLRVGPARSRMAVNGPLQIEG